MMGPVELSEFRDRKVVVADFWAEWCGPCLMAMPGLQELHDEFEGQQLEILAVNLGESPEQIQRFIERKGYTFRVVPDQDHSIGNLFGVTGIPTMVVVGADGRVKRIGDSLSVRWAGDLHEVPAEAWISAGIRELADLLHRPAPAGVPRWTLWH